jgi:hypothetical protein
LLDIHIKPHLSNFSKSATIEAKNVFMSEVEEVVLVYHAVRDRSA